METPNDEQVGLNEKSTMDYSKKSEIDFTKKQEIEPGAVIVQNNIATEDSSLKNDSR